MHYYLTQDHFHYDDSGYYGYILYSGTNEEFRGLLHALGRGDKAHGFGWHRWGRSFRPANNGVVYDYYIRLRNATGAKPSKEDVDDFLRDALPPQVHVVHAAERALEDHRSRQREIQQTQPKEISVEEPASTPSLPSEPPEWATHLQDKFENMNILFIAGFEQLKNNTQRLGEDLPELGSRVNQLQESISPLNDSITRLSTDLAESQLATERAQRELDAKEEELRQLKMQLEELTQQAAAEPSPSVDKSAGLTLRIKELEDQLQNLTESKRRSRRQTVERNHAP